MRESGTKPSASRRGKQTTAWNRARTKRSKLKIPEEIIEGHRSYDGSIIIVVAYRWYIYARKKFASSSSRVSIWGRVNSAHDMGL